MDFNLRCNALKCRLALTDQAVVTTCSHIFCLDCSNILGLSSPSAGARVCPACDTILPNPDDIVATQLNPTEDYKTSVLSGLSPNVIMECAGRALAFWAYQSTQEMQAVYQEYLARTLTDKYSVLSSQMDKVIHDANTEISSLQNKMESMQLDQEALQRKNHELVDAFKEKNRKYLQTQELYDKLKKRTLLSQVQSAAIDSVDETIQSATRHRFADMLENEALHSERHSERHHSSPDHQRLSQLLGNPPNYRTSPPDGRTLGRDGLASIFDRIGSMRAQRYAPQNEAQGTPGHRQRLPLGGHAGAGGQHQSGISGMMNNATQSGRSPTRQPLGVLNGTSTNVPGIAGYGMSAGMKVGRQQSVGQNAASGNGNRSNLTHLPTPTTRAAQSPAILRPSLGGQGNVTFSGRGPY